MELARASFTVEMKEKYDEQLWNLHTQVKSPFGFLGYQHSISGMGHLRRIYHINNWFITDVPQYYSWLNIVVVSV